MAILTIPAFLSLSTNALASETELQAERAYDKAYNCQTLLSVGSKRHMSKCVWKSMDQLKLSDCLELSDRVERFWDYGEADALRVGCIDSSLRKTSFRQCIAAAKTISHDDDLMEATLMKCLSEFSGRVSAPECILASESFENVNTAKEQRALRACGLSQGQIIRLSSKNNKRVEGGPDYKEYVKGVRSGAGPTANYAY